MSISDPIQIDFKQYRTTELYEAVNNLINVKHIFAESFAKIFFTAFAVVVLGGVMFWNRTGTAVWISVVGYSLVAGVLTGALWSVAEVIRQSLDNMLQIVHLLLSVTRQVAHDMQLASLGSARLPSARQLVQAVYCDVFLPIIERVVFNSLGFSGRPFLFLYRLTFGRLMRTVIRLIPTGSPQAANGQSVEETATQVVGAVRSISDNESGIASVLNWTDQKINSFGGRIRFLLVAPSYIVCGIISCLILAPMIITYLLTGAN